MRENDCFEDLPSLIASLDKLRAFSEQFKRFEGTYMQICISIQSGMDRMATNGKQLTTLTQDTSVELLNDFAQQLVKLRILASFAPKLHVHGIDVISCSSALHALENNICSFVRCFDTILSERNSDKDLMDDENADRLQLLSRHAFKLELLHAYFVETRGFEAFAEAIVNAMGNIESYITGNFRDLCNFVIENIDTQPMEVLERQVSSLGAVVASFEGRNTGALSAIVSRTHMSLIERIKTDLKVKYGALDTAARHCLNTGMQDGKLQGDRLFTLHKYLWLDSIVGAELVQSYCDSIHILYRTRLEKVAKMAKAFSSNLSVGSKDNVTALQGCHRAFLEMEQFIAFESIVGQQELVIEKRRDALQGIKQFRKELVQKSEKKSAAWKLAWCNSDFDELKVLTESLDLILGDIAEISLFRCMPGLKKDSIHAKKSIADVFEVAAACVNEEFNKPTNYRRKKDMLFLLSKINCSPNAEAFLPRFNVFKEKARILVSKDALEVEKIVEQSTDGDEIDKCLKVFSEATFLDPYIDDEATNRLRPLRALQERKGDETDVLLASMVRQLDFNGIREFLQPLKSSKNSVKKQKFLQYCRHITKTLKDLANGVHAKLDLNLSEKDCCTISDVLDIMSVAQKEVGSMLTSQDMYIKPDMDSIERKLSQKVLKFSEAVLAGCRANDFLMMGTNYEMASTVVAYAGNYLNLYSKQIFHRAESSYNRSMKSIEQHIKKFQSSGFQEYGCLAQILSSLRNAARSQEPMLPKLSDLYRSAIQTLSTNTESALLKLREGVTNSESYDDGIDILESFDKVWDLSLQHHIETPPFDYKKLLDEWKDKQVKLDLDDSSASPTKRFRNIKLRLDKLSEKGHFDWLPFKEKKSKAYEKLKGRLEEKGAEFLSQSCVSLCERDWYTVRQNLDRLVLMDKELSKHLPSSARRRQELETNVVKTFWGLCEESIKCLRRLESFEEDNLLVFEQIVPDLRQCLLVFVFVLDNEEAQKKFALVNQIVYDTIVKGLREMEAAIQQFDFRKASSLVMHNRTHGAFLVDHYSLIKEELMQRGKMESEEWLTKIAKLCTISFSCGRDFANIKSCAILGVLPSATEEEIRKAYKECALRVHPDKMDKDSEDSGEEFRRVKDAHDILIGSRSREIVQSTKRLFDSQILAMPEALRRTTKQNLQNQRYDQVLILLEKMPEFEVVCDLVDPALDYNKTSHRIASTVQDWVRTLKVDVDKHWANRNYKELNLSINDLKEMEKQLSSFPNIFPDAWNEGIIKKVNTEIESLGIEARKLLKDKSTAHERRDDFRRCFIQMAFVMVELQPFKFFTKSVMDGVLESCLDSDWGYSYLFDLGLSFHRGDESANEDENRIAQTLLSEFSQFKEVMTMVWNEETLTKPVKDTVRDIVGKQWGSGGLGSPVNINQEELLRNFHAFEAEYNSLLGEFLCANAETKNLAQKLISLANSIKPLSCERGWTVQVKAQIPGLLAGVFALFTILKSGESYNRIQGSVDNQNIGDKLLMKPHNIQVLTLLHLLGCAGNSSDTGLESHLMQIRTGEGKSMILGAAAAVLGLLGFRVRCVCYSEYLSARDYSLFEEVFQNLRLVGRVSYSKITTLSEATTARKGDIRILTEDLLRRQLGRGQPRLPAISNHLSAPPQPQSRDVSLYETVASNVTSAFTGLVEYTTGSAVQTKQQDTCEEILLIDEIDVFFSPFFYGQTYNKVMELREPEIAEILLNIWSYHCGGGRKQKLTDIESSLPYQRLLQKLPLFKFMIDNEIKLMLDHVHRVDEEPYYLDSLQDRIGYKVLDTVTYQATYGYRTVFAYLKEGEAGNLQDKNAAYKRVLNMPIQCGQFSYANISPTRILGVSGTLEAMSDFEKNVLDNYGVDKYIYVPSVYGQSNFVFDKAGDGIFIEESKSDYFQKITEEVQDRIKGKRAVIVFFENGKRLEEFKRSPFFSKLGRQKEVLTEDMDAGAKEFAINKAATSGQITLSTAVFGRGTDFFCKDDRVQEGGGVHIIQTFLSLEKSEEVQIQGRTSRQGKKGSYQLVLLEEDLCKKFGLAKGEQGTIPRSLRYNWLSEAREKKHGLHWKNVTEHLKVATKRDSSTHEYFDALLAGNESRATGLFRDLYLAMNKPPMPEAISVDLALLLDITGSMAPYVKPTIATIKSLVSGTDSITTKLKTQFPDTKIKLRIAVLGYRDIDDGGNQFNACLWNGCHFTESVPDALQSAERTMTQASAGHDLAEDHLGAVNHCLSWNGPNDWSSPIKLALLFTDAPAHGYVPQASRSLPNADSYAIRHPKGLTPNSIAGALLAKGLNLIFCSYNPSATALTGQELSKAYDSHSLNSEQQELKVIPMIPVSAVTSTSSSGQPMIGDYPRHIVFILDESGSMQGNWSGVVSAYTKYAAQRRQNQNDSDIVSVVQFDGTARVTVSQQPIRSIPTSLPYRGGGTQFSPAALEGSRMVAVTPTTHRPVVVFMSDGGTDDAPTAASTFRAVNQQVRQKHGCDLDLHVIAFGSGADTQQLQQICQSSPKGRVYLSSDTVQLTNIFVNIAGGTQVATVLQEEIAREISDAVSDTLSLGYLY